MTLSANLLAFGEDIRDAQRLKPFEGLAAPLVLKCGKESVWLLYQPSNEGGFALRTSFLWGVDYTLSTESWQDQVLCYTIQSDLGEQKVTLRIHQAEHLGLTVDTVLTPKVEIALPYWPRDLFLIGPDGSPASSKGVVHASQKGLSAGALFLDANGFCLYYFQDYTTLQPYFERLDSSPDDTVGGEWPELGYRPPASESKTLQPSKQYAVYSTHVQLGQKTSNRPADVFRCFLALSEQVYSRLDRPETNPGEWPKRAQNTLKALEDTEEVKRRDFGKLFLRPYVDSEYPDSMSQLAIIRSLHDYGRWRGEPVKLNEALQEGVGLFFDNELRTVRRYLPNVGKDKDRDEVDAWYLYHPLSSLGRMALDGVEWAKTLFLQGLEFGITAAHKFKYEWPVKYNLKTLEVTDHNRKEGEPGQTDVGGIYAYVMVQAYELTSEDRYLEEARKALDKVLQYRFQLLYQANLSSLGCVACAKLWRHTKDQHFLKVLDGFFANILHNTVIWSSDLKAAKSYETFLGVHCLSDATYMAAYECAETTEALAEMLQESAEALSDSTRHLAAEFFKYGLTRGRSFFPDELQKEALATEIRNGKIMRYLSIPLEDLYADGRPAGSVGQEVYGAGMPFLFCKLAYHPLLDDLGWLFSEYPLARRESSKGRLSFQALGSEKSTFKVKYVPKKRRSSIVVNGKELSKGETLEVPGNIEIIIG
ncbi:MAG: hypothetical protein KIT11_03720 [Fimbriimonadaceae bacterium]|nr:hypothetical protein [Fimbriimonadaceae bacterium]QYK56994.1 MAG: hypothetical protein KF733_05805 [Fimbriimonadaceae bacterium]